MALTESYYIAFAGIVVVVVGISAALCDAAS